MPLFNKMIDSIKEENGVPGKVLGVDSDKIYRIKIDKVFSIENLKTILRNLSNNREKKITLVKKLKIARVRIIERIKEKGVASKFYLVFLLENSLFCKGGDE